MSVDKFKTAILNGYTEGQAQGLERWSEAEFMIFMEEVIRPDGERVQIVYEDGTVRPLRRRDKNVWQKSKHGDGEWCFSEDNPMLVSDLSRNGGRLMMAGHSYSLNGKYINRQTCNV